MEANNAAALREAVDGIENTANNALTALSLGNDTSGFLWGIISKCEAALAKPPRNCDVGTLTGQQQRFHDFCEKMQHTDKACCGGCPIVRLRMKGIISNSCELAWAQMPYEANEEGGAE